MRDNNDNNENNDNNNNNNILANVKTSFLN